MIKIWCVNLASKSLRRWRFFCSLSSCIGFITEFRLTLIEEYSKSGLVQSNFFFIFRRRNRSGCASFLIQSFTMIILHFFNSILDPKSASILLFICCLAVFLLKSKSNDFICKKIKLIEISVSVISFWISFALMILTVRVDLI